MGTDKEEAKTDGSADVNGSSSFGPEPPKEDEYDEGEIKKAEEFKQQGNEYFKSKLFISRK